MVGVVVYLVVLEEQHRKATKCGGIRRSTSKISAMQEITRDEYLKYYNKNKEVYDKTIDPSQYSDKYFTLDFKSFVGLHFQKGNIVQVNGLFSVEQGYGRRLLNYVVDTYDKVRLNCTNSLIEYYSKYWNVNIYYKSEDLDYCEMFVHRK